MKVLLTTLNARYIHTSLALFSLEKYCQQDKYEILVKEFTINDRLDIVTGIIYQIKADIVAFSCYIWNRNEIFEIADRLKKVKPDLIIIMGGPEVTFSSRDIMKNNDYIDYIIMGEGEVTLRELLNYLGQEGYNNQKDTNSLEDIPGLLYRDKINKIIENQERTLICNLDNLPPAYNKEDLTRLSNKIIYYESSRGCPFNCSYCLSSTTRGVRYFSLERVKKDLLFLIKNKVKLVKFVDRTFNADKDRAMEIFKFLVENRFKTSYHFEITVDLMDEDMVNYLVEIPAGIFQFEVGIQSTNEETLQLINRKMDFRKISYNIKRLREANNIHLHLDLIAGLPKESYSSFENSFNDVFDLSPHNLQLGFLKLLKGSIIRRETPVYDYKYATTPPYEVLENQDIAYEEILELKGIEDVLEKYYNSAKFGYCLQFIIYNYYQASPFNFFQGLARYFVDKGLNRKAHRQETLFNILYEFYCQKIGLKVKTFAEYLKFDFVLNNRAAKLPYWASIIEIPDYKNRRYRFFNNAENIKHYLPDYLNASVKEILKDVSIETFKLDILSNKTNTSKIDPDGLFVYLFIHSKNTVLNITSDF